jgi:3'(2'), 5'-bisphosphate nucleotidase
MTHFKFEHAGPRETAIFLAEAALAAGPAVMDVYAHGGDVETKLDGSPVTLADRRAEEIICGFLCSRAAPPPIVAEESASRVSAGVERFLLVDPLDGTREFLARNDEFTINVALIERGAPVAGAVYAPALGRLWFGGGESFVCDVRPGETVPESSCWRPIHTRRAPDALVAVASRSHGDPQTDSFLSKLPLVELRSRGSSLKFCLLAEGLADVYARFGATMEWDTAAGDAVLRSAGGVVLDESGIPLIYGKVDRELRNGAFVAWGDPEAPGRFVQR